jgi:hypothetical protein
MPFEVTVAGNEGAVRSWFAKGMRSRRLLLALAVYVGVTLVLLWSASPSVLSEHTRYNHFALLASSWLEGRLDLGGPPPDYTGNNDFASFDGKWFVVFPPFPSVLLLPLVALAGDAEAVCDGRWFLLLAGVAPAVLFLVLEKLSRSGDSKRSEADNLVLSALFCFGSVYFFTSVQGSVWFAAHVVGAGLLSLYVLFSLSAERPLLAGACLALGFATRTPLVFAAPLFVLEALRATRRSTPLGPGLVQRYYAGKLLGRLSLFALPLALVLAFTLWHNAARFGDPFEVGYRYLDVAWKGRIEKWGLFDYHYLGRNLGVILASLPWLPANGSGPIQVNGHGLALWLTTPMYLWLLRARGSVPLVRRLLVTATLVALPTLFYQNTGWVQFGYRFSNDYSVLLFVLLAVAGPPLRGAFVVVSAFAVTVNFFGALTFGRPEHAHFYFIEASQRIIFQPD